MLVTITSRHEEVPEALRERAEAVIARLAKRAHRPIRAQVEFDFEHHRASAEIRLHAARNVAYVAGADAQDHRTALDRAAAKIRRQLDTKPATGRRDGARKEK
jgi:ribosomal subunit interface protein